MKNEMTTEQKIQELDQAYTLTWALLQDYAKGSRKHRELTAEFLRLSAELIKLKQSLSK